MWSRFDSLCRVLTCALLAAELGAVGCDRAKVQEPEHERVIGQARPPSHVVLSGRLARPAVDRVVAIGDLHGDLDHTRRALRLAGAVDERDRWTGGHLLVVQTGDEIDRGDDDRAILDLVDDLSAQAAASGGGFLALLGNHEVMNASQDFRYVTPGGFAAFALLAPTDAEAPPGLTPQALGRAGAFHPGAAYAERLARRPIVAKVGDTIFVHGGILPKHLAYGLDRMNDELDDWLRGRRSVPPSIVVADDGPVWTRAYGASEDANVCSLLSTTLRELDAKRMVIGHTVQRGGISSICGGQVWRIDVGLSHYFGGAIEVLEIRKDEVTVLLEDSGVRNVARRAAGNDR